MSSAIDRASCRGDLSCDLDGSLSTVSAHSQPARDEILATVADIARQELDHEGPVEPSHRLVEDLELDSIRLLTLATAVEDHFRILLDEADESSIVTVADLLDVIETKLTAKLAGETA